MENQDDLLAEPGVGASWEGFVIEQILAHLAATGQSYQASYLRTSDQYEVDLVIDRARERWAIEVKLTSAPGPDDWARLQKAAEIAQADRSVLVSRTPTIVESKRAVSCDLGWLLEALS